ncbi:DNA-binding SARP family transcriptional activator [Crossiella equi]|uniref:DNA-binding SARP family transcriptional activator n=1 Tax=Crossiella equi TaxID=130796 RepID=A0ABS5AA80_9PSEU|nr:BTAD domain-containing putative transcriptional regulator [Crossiella equi]MBP2473493.1 DNA-binding SARP family transcriptional activator [Crossiella equi]
MEAAIRVRLLGQVTATGRSGDLELGPPRQRALFAVLAARTGQAVSREELIEAVWGASPPATVESSVYTYVARLRRSLEPRRALRAPAELLVGDTAGYSLQLPSDRVDTHVFQDRLDRVRQLAVRGAVRLALSESDGVRALWGGTPFGGTPGPFAEEERRRLEELWFGAQEQRAEMLLEVDRPTEVLGELAELVRRHPLRERPRLLRMLAFHRCGRRADALAEFREAREALIRELGIEPSVELQRCHQQILRSGPGQAGGGRPAPAQLPREVPPFTGRARELARLRALGTEPGAVLLLDGPAGVGKTALALRLAHELAESYPDGQLFLDLEGYAADARPLTAAEALGHLLAGLGGSQPAETSPGRLLAQFRSAVAGRRLLLVLDNAASAHQVRPLLPGSPTCLVLVTSRNRMPGLAARDGARRLTVPPMSEAEAEALLADLVSPPLPPERARRLAQACDHLPVALRLAAELLEEGTHALPDLLAAPTLLHHLAAPDDACTSIRTLLSWTYRTLPEEAAALFRVLGHHPARELALTAAAAMADTDLDRTSALADLLCTVHLAERPCPGRLRLSGLTQAYARDLSGTQDPPGHHQVVLGRLVRHHLHAGPGEHAVALAVCERAERAGLPELARRLRARLAERAREPVVAPFTPFPGTAPAPTDPR